MNLIVTIAVGNKSWGERALNLSLSVKANDDEQKTMLIYTKSAIEGIEGLINDHFDYGLCYEMDSDNPSEFAFHLKTRLYGIVSSVCKDFQAVIYLDADTIIIPGKSTKDWFEDHYGTPFTSYCNDVYDYETKTRKRTDYTFWCDPEKVKVKFNILHNAKMPQINTSFMYFEAGIRAKYYFMVAENVWNEHFEYKEYRNSKPDELCFNIASSMANLLPHKTTYRPIFFEFCSSVCSAQYINHQFTSFGFAGEKYPSAFLLKLYNDTAAYYRNIFGISHEFNYIPETNTANKYLPIAPDLRRTLYRIGEVENSGGGIFNPSAIMKRDELVTIYRKETGIEKGRYSGKSAIAHVDCMAMSFEMISDAPEDMRIEDFRLFELNGGLYVNHSIAKNIYTTDIECSCGVSKIKGDKLEFIGASLLPIAEKKVEKNWAFFSDSVGVYCIYSLNPYLIFASTDLLGEWRPINAKQPKLKWINDGFISNSTNPILIGDSYLMFFHSKENGVYYHGAVLIDKETKEITHATPRAFNLPFNNEGLAKNILYVSGAIYLKDTDRVRIYCGECDSNSIYYEFDKEKLIKQIKKYPC